MVRTAGKGSLFSHCFIFPVKFVPCVPLLPPVKKRVQIFLVLPPVRSSPLPGDHEFFIYLTLDPPWASYSFCLLTPFTVLSLFNSDWPRFHSLIPKRDFGALPGRQAGKLSLQVSVYIHSLPSTRSVRGSACSIPSPRFFLVLSRPQAWTCFLFLLVTENIRRSSSMEIATADEQLAWERVVMLPYSVFLIEEQIIYFGGKKCKFFCICMSKWPL